MASQEVNALLTELAAAAFSPLDLVPGQGLVEKVVELALAGVPPGAATLTGALSRLAGHLEEVATNELKVVVFGGGTGLSNLVGGDSRYPAWPDEPFRGLKELFPHTSAVVCVTDDGGSTGELLKDLDLIALGDLRHVLLSSIRRGRLQQDYQLSEPGCQQVVAELFRLFNYRFVSPPANVDSLLRAADVELAHLPLPMRDGLAVLLADLFTRRELQPLLLRPHCLGNLLLVAAIRAWAGAGEKVTDWSAALPGGLAQLAELLGAGADAVLPCCTTPSQLKLLYANGVMVTGEYKSGHARRGCPVERAYVATSGAPVVPGRVLELIAAADIIVYAPGSLYTSIIPILQLPDIVAAVRANAGALKLLVTNLWVQKGETDLVPHAGGRRFHVSDLLGAYQRNIPGGISGLFQELIVMGLHDIPGSILQSYALEGKVPIYFDRERVAALGLLPLECRIYSTPALEKKRVVQHDPAAMAKAIRAIWAVRQRLPSSAVLPLPVAEAVSLRIAPPGQTPARRHAALVARLDELAIAPRLRQQLAEILWRHQDIALAHLDYLAGVVLVEATAWPRSQEWDRIFSFYDPDDRLLKIRADVFAEPDRFELAFLVALGESLLGNYAAAKEMRPVADETGLLGRVFRLTLRPLAARQAWLGEADLHDYLNLARMSRSEHDPLVYTRLVSGAEGFTPPGLLFGLVYAWYLDNRFAPHIEYKMAILRMEVPDMIPEQLKVGGRRRRLVDFFRQRVFGFAEVTLGPEIGDWEQL
ncbi:MAG: YvcK family protein [Desulfobulbaceae bacterium]|nr:YvcK family protein [Desulfobulbaceae bacterium]